MKKNNTIYFLLLLISAFCFAQCKKERNSQPHVGFSVTLYNKPLDTIQFYLQGKWKWQYAEGGFVYSKYYPRYNSYMTLNSNRIIFQNDSAGILVDTVVYWKRVAWPNSFQDSTYLMSYFYTPGYAFAYNYFIDGIFNDTLKFHDYASDPIFYYYTKSN